MPYDLMGDVVAIFIMYIASDSLASDRHLHDSESDYFFPRCHNSTLLSITNEYSLFSIFLNAGDQLQSKTLEWGRRAFCCSLWMVFGPLDIMCKKTRSIAFARATHLTLGLFFALILYYFVWWVLVFKHQPALATAKMHFWMVTHLR